MNENTVNPDYGDKKQHIHIRKAAMKKKIATDISKICQNKIVSGKLVRSFPAKISSNSNPSTL